MKIYMCPQCEGIQLSEDTSVPTLAHLYCQMCTFTMLEEDYINKYLLGSLESTEDDPDTK